MVGVTWCISSSLQVQRFGRLKSCRSCRVAIPNASFLECRGDRGQKRLTHLAQHRVQHVHADRHSVIVRKDLTQRRQRDRLSHGIDGKHGLAIQRRAMYITAQLEAYAFLVAIVAYHHSDGQNWA